MDTSLDEMYADIKALTSRWEEDAARLVNRWLDEERANGINTIEAYEKRDGNKNSGNAETALTGSQKAAFMLIAIENECSPIAMEHFNDGKRGIKIASVDELIPGQKGGVIDALGSLLKLHNMIEAMGAKGYSFDKPYEWRRIGGLLGDIMEHIVRSVGVVLTGEWQTHFIV